MVGAEPSRVELITGFIELLSYTQSRFDEVSGQHWALKPDGVTTAFDHHLQISAILMEALDLLIATDSGIGIKTGHITDKLMKPWRENGIDGLLGLGESAKERLAGYAISFYQRKRDADATAPSLTAQLAATRTAVDEEYRKALQERREALEAEADRLRHLVVAKVAAHIASIRTVLKPLTKHRAYLSELIQRTLGDAFQACFLGRVNVMVLKQNLPSEAIPLGRHVDYCASQFDNLEKLQGAVEEAAKETNQIAFELLTLHLQGPILAGLQIAQGLPMETLEATFMRMQPVIAAFFRELVMTPSTDVALDTIPEEEEREGEGEGKSEGVERGEGKKGDDIITRLVAEWRNNRALNAIGTPHLIRLARHMSNPETVATTGKEFATQTPFKKLGERYGERYTPGAVVGSPAASSAAAEGGGGGGDSSTAIPEG